MQSQRRLNITTLKSVHVLKQSSKGFKWKRMEEGWVVTSVFFIVLARARAWLPLANSPTCLHLFFYYYFKIHIHVKTYCTEVLLNKGSLLPILSPTEAYLFDNRNYLYSREYLLKCALSRTATIYLCKYWILRLLHVLNKTYDPTVTFTSFKLLARLCN